MDSIVAIINLAAALIGLATVLLSLVHQRGLAVVRTDDTPRPYRLPPIEVSPRRTKTSDTFHGAVLAILAANPAFVIVPAILSSLGLSMVAIFTIVGFITGDFERPFAIYFILPAALILIAMTVFLRFAEEFTDAERRNQLLTPEHQAMTQCQPEPECSSLPGTHP